MKNKLHQKFLQIEKLNITHNTQQTFCLQRWLFQGKNKLRVLFNKERFSSQAFLLDCHEYKPFPWKYLRVVGFFLLRMAHFFPFDVLEWQDDTLNATLLFTLKSFRTKLFAKTIWF